ncbi:MAG: MFS transporter, partial [Candidatus Njordarchaeota archaeon]
RSATSFFFLAFFSGACYALDPNRGLLSVISSAKLGLVKATTLHEYLAQLPIIGLIMASFGIAAAVGALIMGSYTDKMGHRKSYYLSLTGFLFALSLWLIDLEVVGMVFFPKNPILGGIVLLSVILGFFEGWNFVAWETLIADLCPPQLTSFVFQYGMTGTHFSAFLVAFVAGYIIESYGIIATLIIVISIIAVGYIPVLFFRPFRTSKIILGGE